MVKSKPVDIFQQKRCADWCCMSRLGPIVSKNNLCQIQKLPYVLYRHRYRIRLEGKSSIGIDIEFEKKEQLANIRFRTQTNVYRTTLIMGYLKQVFNSGHLKGTLFVVIHRRDCHTGLGRP